MSETRRSKASLLKSRKTPIRTQDELDVYLPYLVARIASNWNAELNRKMAPHQVNTTIARALSVLFIHRQLTVNQIAGFAVVEQSNASRTIESMVIAGLVKRQIAQDDLRRREVILTEKGEELLRQLWPMQSLNYQDIVRDIPEEDLSTCVRVLGKILSNQLEKPV